ncbi:MAG TPA: hypothetical protein VMF30_02535, partial [Pirellulales bacterium]|nr:hypothetical protein [Pirellulales bacterium]
LLLATATAGLAASTVLLMEQAKQTEQERARAEANFRQARQAVDTFTRLSDEELLSTRAPMQRARRRFLETALEYYQGFLDQHRDDPSLETELAASSARVSRLLDELTAREGDAPIFLFMDPAVQRELAGSNADLQASMTRLSDSFSREQTQLLQQYVHLSRDEREGHWAKLMHETELRITALLSPEQLNRLRQIALQQQFVRAFDNPRVVEALQLTRAQRDKIHDIQDESSLAILNKWPRDIKESRNLLEQTWRTDIARIVELLTPEQAAAWKDLIGKPFEEELRFRPPGGWNR